ncbi:hypothetical protein VTI74DRAFT_4414 [Chaetomium olivicolor]
MKYFGALLAAAAVVSVAAESISDYIPACAVSCLTTAIGAATKCKGPTDLECFCVVENYRAIYDSGVSCVLQACGNDVSVGEVLPAASGMCEQVVARSGKPVTSVGYPTTSGSAPTPTPAATDAPAASTTAPAPSTTSTPNSVSSLSVHMLGVIAPVVLVAAANL